MPVRSFTSGWLAAVLALFVAVGPDATGQSAACQNNDGYLWTCEDGFTCVRSFGGGDLFERFTLYVTESTNPNADVWITIETNGTFVVYEVGHAEQGEAFAWTKRTEAEGESYFRIDNRNANDPIRARIDCNRADTELTEPADAGDDEIEVMDTTPFAVGDSILVDPGGPNEERNVVVAFGSLLLETPLQHAHAAGVTVVSIGPGPISTANEAAPEARAALSLAAFPNPSRATASVALVLDGPQHVTVVVHDALGREVAVLHDGPLAAGARTLPFDAAGLPSGAYVIRATTPSGTVAQRVTLVR